MQKQLDFQVNVRGGRGKNEARRLRAGGQVPGVLYGMGKDTVAISIDAKGMIQVLKSPSGQNQILNLKVDGTETSAAMAVDWQVDPLRGDLLHVDMKRIDLNRKVEVRVPFRTTGVPIGVKEQGGMEETLTREIEVESLPLQVPEVIEVDVTDLEIGDAIHVRDLPASDEYSYLTPEDRILVHVVAPRLELELEEEVAEGEEEAPEGAEAAPEDKDKEQEDKEKEKSKEAEESKSK